VAAAAAAASEHWGVPAGKPLRIGNRVTVGHAAILHGCTIEDDVLIGMGWVPHATLLLWLATPPALAVPQAPPACPVTCGLTRFCVDIGRRATVMNGARIGVGAPSPFICVGCSDCDPPLSRLLFPVQ
jgi:hypothetical protein